MKKRINLPKDELPHKNQAVEWWYFNGFLEGKRKYAIMTCLFKASDDEVKLVFLKPPFREVYFSHTLLFDLTNKTLKKEILPTVFLLKGSFKRKDLFVGYFFPFRKDFIAYEISRQDGNLRIKTKFFDLISKQAKKPLLENGSGFIDYGKASTHYYSYTNLDTKGYVGKDLVKGKLWHDRQWTKYGFSKGAWAWNWFSVQTPDNMEIVCVDCGGKKFADILYADGRQETCKADFRPLGKTWESPVTGLKYELEWEIKVKNFLIKTKPFMKKCEVNFGRINYWEGPLQIRVNGKKAKGFMELLLKGQPTMVKSLLKQGELEILKQIKKYRYGHYAGPKAVFVAFRRLAGV